MSAVIINADDFGLNGHNSKAIAGAFAKGLITDTTMMATGDYFDEAAALAREQGFIDRIGIHLNLTEGEPLTEDIKDCPRFVNSGRFYKPYAPVKDLTAGETDAVYRELTAQVERIKAAGIVITHADSHHYIHNNPFLAPVVMRVCRESGIRRIRLQRNLGSATGFEENNRFWREHGFITTAYFGRMSDIADGEIPGITEIMVHPDFDRNGSLIDRRGAEDGYPAGELLRDCKANGVTLLSYRDLA